jgi:hypothetical protein
MAERHFTPREVEALIPRLTAIMERTRRAHADATTRRERLRQARQRLELAGGGVVDRAAWQADKDAIERAAQAVQEGLDEIVELGGVPKDLEVGLVDFPFLRGGRTVNLCWKFGEREIRFWHGLDEGYAARKPL